MTSLRSMVFAALAAVLPAQSGGVRIADAEVFCAVPGGTNGFVAAGAAIVPGARWLRLRFLPVDLPVGARVRFVAEADGASVVFERDSWRRFQYATPYWNGAGVTIEVDAPAGADVVLRAIDVIAGFAATAAADSVCGVDDRTPATTSAVARVLDAQFLTVCSGALVRADDLLLTAGHCAAFGSGLVAQFDPPPSLADGTLQHPPPERQYAVDWTTANWQAFAPGEDWALMKLFPNPVTGQSASAVHGFLPLAATPPPAGVVVRVTGYGADAGADDHARQSDAGPLTLVGGATGAEVRYAVDTAPGSSGSPVVHEATGQVIGVHVADGCAFGGSNLGTSIAAPALQLHLATSAAVPANLYLIGMWQTGPGSPLVLGVTGAPPGAELFNLLTFTPRTPLGSGPLFGIDPGDGAVFAIFGTPPGTEPFHVTADGAGSYLFATPTSGVVGAFSGDLVSVAFGPGGGFAGYLAQSQVTNVTFTL
jgi:V8-like Glu-specific endopeptidase